jgi:hypothetical protein
MFVRAARRMEVCANTEEPQSSGVGIVVESRGASDVVVRSAGGMSLSCAGDMFVGRRADETEEGTRTGTVVLDAAAGGNLYVRGGDSALVEAATASICSIRSDSGSDNSMLRLDGSGVQIAATRLDAMTSMVLRAPASGVTVGLPRNGEVRDVRVGTPGTDQESLVVGGQLVVNGQAKINRSAVVCAPLIANGVASVSESCMVLAEKARARAFKPADLPDQLELARAVAAASGAADAAALSQTDGGMRSSEYADSHRFSFPKDYGVDASAVVPGMAWQQRVDENGQTWRESPVPAIDEGGPTMCYPGIRVWEGAKLSRVTTDANGSEHGSLVPLASAYKLTAIRRQV